MATPSQVQKQLEEAVDDRGGLPTGGALTTGGALVGGKLDESLNRDQRRALRNAKILVRAEKILNKAKRTGDEELAEVAKKNLKISAKEPGNKKALEEYPKRNTGSSGKTDWVTFVKAKSKELGIPYGQALQDITVRNEYHVLKGN